MEMMVSKGYTLIVATSPNLQNTPRNYKSHQFRVAINTVHANAIRIKFSKLKKLLPFSIHSNFTKQTQNSSEPVSHSSNRTGDIERLTAGLLPPFRARRQGFLVGGSIGPRNPTIGLNRANGLGDTGRVCLVGDREPLGGLVDEDSPTFGAQGVACGVVEDNLRETLARLAKRVRHLTTGLVGFICFL